MASAVFKSVENIEACFLRLLRGTEAEEWQGAAHGSGTRHPEGQCVGLDGTVELDLHSLKARVTS